MKPGLRLAIVLTLAATTLATPASTQGPRLSAVMREKLDHAKNILGAVVTSEALVAGQDALFAVIADVPGRYVTDVKLTAYGFELVKVKQIAPGGAPG